MTKKKKNKKPTRNQLNSWIKFSNIGFQMAIIIGGGTYLGVWLDEKYPNNYSTYTIICSLVSVFIALYVVIRQVKNLNKDEEE
ncbi:AtpZ/AtpI family protein [Galbibacter sp. EGI 63066]|uniref:AtpZ/AtpI family protein n=1 Tax=Galbibacter sp. EGI 63066 TaxID=2993559 RepID=UPI0022491383|nr:AtpZ/AtpI family protein [Galbibacter sp. EGI 63066]MCX2681183.1 AtpZ/AtpI family protein [Galbibacter sp. EGI 63066]